MRKTNTFEINIFLNTWANYNENGADGGFWISLPCDLDAELEKLAASTGEELEEMEVFVNDYESGFPGLEISENSDISELNEIAETLEELDEWELETVESILEVGAYITLQDAIKYRDDCILYSDCETLEDLAYQLVDEGCFGDIPESFSNYIDYKAIARDLNYDSYYETKNGVIYIG